MGLLSRIIGWITGGALDRVLDTVDKKIASETDRERIKAEIVSAHMQTRAEWMRAGGFWLMLMFALPLAVWHGAVVIYSILWCAGCAFPQDWHVAALPRPLDEWAGIIITAIFGVVGVSRIGKR